MARDCCIGCGQAATSDLTSVPDRLLLPSLQFPDSDKICGQCAGLNGLLIAQSDEAALVGGTGDEDSSDGEAGRRSRPSSREFPPPQQAIAGAEATVPEAYPSTAPAAAAPVLAGEQQQRQQAAPAQHAAPLTPTLTEIPAEQIRQYRQTFALFDQDSSGTIDASELQACLKAMGHHTTPLELDQLMQKMDTDGNGVITFEEFVAAMSEQAEDDEMEAQLHEMRTVFSIFDRDDNGRVDADELLQAMRLLGVRITPEEAAFWLQEIDTDGDGDVSFEEFVSYIVQYDHLDDHSAASHGK